MKVEDLLDPTNDDSEEGAIFEHEDAPGDEIWESVVMKNSKSGVALPEPSLFSPVLNSIWHNSLNSIQGTKLGQIWDSTKAFRAYSKGKLKSIYPSSRSVRVVFRNLTEEPLGVCWINYEGLPEMFTTLPSQTFPSKFQANKITSKDLVQNISFGDTFCFIDTEDLVEAEETQQFDDMLGAYRPLALGVDQELGEQAVHLVTIEEQHGWIKNKIRSNESRLRGQEDTEVTQYVLHTRLVMLDMTPLDSSNKMYNTTEIGGWAVYAEDDWHGGDENLKARIENDLIAAYQLLPDQPRTQLVQAIPFYFNKSIEYGPKECPIRGEGMAFHSDKSWLFKMGMSTEKYGCIELYDASAYLEDCDEWGPGGAFLHYLAQAYHFKYVENGFDNEDIKRCFLKTTSEMIYDNSHLLEKGENPADSTYTCRNEREYFSVQSTAFLGGLDADQHYNIQQPFNSHQIKAFDAQAYRMLQKIWKTQIEVPKPSTPVAKHVKKTTLNGKKKAPSSGTRRKVPLTTSASSRSMN